ncbi:MAG: hypothetical protein P9F19_10995 [Candidatus Contendobacter sp.]|nr:hypothetical protein [Candidatus Contendobacter sp.]MDG4557894.1 hypothetical protein [Candidatus Contendobacter sp.]
MPEITSVEAVRAKLREFDERVDGAITAAKTLTRIKTDAEKLLRDLEVISTKGEQSLQKAENIRLKLQELQNEWNALKEGVIKAQAESQETRDFLRSELNSAIQTIRKRLTEAEEGLRSTNRASLSEQAELLTHLEQKTRDNATVVEKAKAVTSEHVKQLDQLLLTLRDELQGEVRTKLLHAEELLESQFQRLSEELNDRSTRHEQLLKDEIARFKIEMKHDLAEHQHALDQQLTDFLSRQNILIQNLTQQIDSYNRVSQTQAVELSAIKSKIKELLPTRPLLAEIQSVLATHDERLTAFESLSKTTTSRLDEMLEKLKKSFFVGGKFKS